MSGDFLSLQRQFNELTLGVQKRVEHAFEVEKFKKLRKTVPLVIGKINAAQKEIIPADEERKRTLMKFAQGEALLSKREWRVICWSLNDRIGKTKECALGQNNLWKQVEKFIRTKIAAQQLAKRLWMGMVYSYFSADITQADNTTNLKKLRNLLLEGLTSVEQAGRKERAWIKAARDCDHLFSAQPTKILAELYLDENIGVFNSLQEHVAIPETSWLWDSLVESIGQKVGKANDEAFRTRIDSLLNLGTLLPRYKDSLFGAALNRYSQAKFKDELHRRLKVVSLEHWGNPQIKSKANIWKAHLTDEAFRMVLNWFAREDLEYFFKLLQGSSQVDQARLDYWMRFVDQMGYTRIVLGRDAYHNRSADFMEFKQANKGRYSSLSGDVAQNNAFIFQIGKYYFVEFSAGGACYVYHESKIPFQVESIDLNTQTQLKIPYLASSRITHNGNWQPKMDYELRTLGITPSHEGIKKAEQIRKNSLANIPARKITSQTKVSSGSALHSMINAALTKPAEDKRHRDIEAAKAFIKILRLSVATLDNVSTGGGFWVFISNDPNPLVKKLIELGFLYKPGKGFWR
ncbi:EH signature protein [Limnobacter thiooxidans]|uniref:EH signature domain-containing protein n=1 Tax=Limnobacter thiooxidans TaxID=131080 RepID=A0AA86JMT5_9BURK|nr:EH signature protein [Limnobacter thiooxidans]BET27622.1 EH signature domain-containing protein [Limnobacter thiooxidans]